MFDARLKAITVVKNVFDGQPLCELPALCQFFVYGLLRHHESLNYLTEQLLDKPLKAKDFDMKLLIHLGLFQLLYSRIKPHAIVNETVKCCAKLKKIWAKNLINAVLRKFLREKDRLMSSLKTNDANYNTPEWLLQTFRRAYPSDWQTICRANQTQAPLTLRINLSRITREQYGNSLKKAGMDFEICETVASGIRLKTACDVSEIPGFSEGLCSVQDEAAQKATFLLAPKPGEKVLDVCAAPGGKTCHLLEYEPGIDLTAIDISETRLKKVTSNLQRLNLSANLVCDDALHYLKQHPESFDAILLDAPCSALGVVRRHPEIPYLRDASQVETVIALQKQLLSYAAKALKPGGRLLYATCSILPEENTSQIHTFLKAHETLTLQFEVQILPGDHDRDGFYYGLLSTK